MNVFKITFAENWIQLRKISYCIQMKKTTITAVFIILVITGLFPVHALATPSSYVRTNADGLSNSSITCMYQDSLDRLWIGTWDGLNVYDSHDMIPMNSGYGSTSRMTTIQYRTTSFAALPNRMEE